ncbi:Sodium/calcium exchanger protein-domain-containing protein [Morchella snyderi]|nr:Sodium/calcium exchanger protein-domain-containing protein [Morchella snyderi]
MGAWLIMLFTTIGIAASDFFCINLSTIANILGMSESMAGVTFLAFGNGSPDVFSTFAAMKINSGSLAVGELIGAASFIAAVVAGSMAIVHPFKVGKKSFVRDVSFFIVAVLFGIFFLADGQIQMWECVVMVVFYLFYVCFVVVWHWVSQSRKKRRRLERNVREHYTAPEEEENLLVDDDDEDGGVGRETDGLLASSHDFSALERGTNMDDDTDDAEEQEQAAYASFSNNMRIQRPRMERSMTPATPHNIRPSLVGALEFRAVLHHLEKNKNLAGRPIHLRRYSDDPFLSSATSAHSAPGSLMNAPLSSIPHRDNQGRLRAVSVNAASQPPMDWGTYQSGQLPPLPDVTVSSPMSPRPDLFIETTPSLSLRTASPDLLALPNANEGRPNAARLSPTSSEPTSPFMSAGSPTLLVPPSPSSDISSPRHFGSPRGSSSRGSSPPASIRLPPPSLDSMSLGGLSGTPTAQWRHISWWPYKRLPPPQLLAATLFPTLLGFREKSITEKLLAVIAMVPVFLLTITLPVVEADADSASESTPADTPIVVLDAPESPSDDTHHHHDHHNHDTPIGPKTWNRWLVATQCLTAPVFLVIMFAWDDDPATSLTKPILWALIAGLVSLGVLLTFTTPAHAPRSRYLLCFAGFAVSIGWISAIANEVVGVLKAFGVVLGISDAILGLTIFAVGNSLGDLVADITVARLGFPVMALSACFGGPMLNILLGVGLSGLWITAGREGHEAYKIEVARSLVVSAATLLLTLVVLLVAVPANGWMMSRGIGWCLIGLWAVSTAVNVAGEVGGWWT